MHPIDWILVSGSMVIVLFIGLYTQRYVKSVADFLSAGRVARRYLLAVAKGEMAAGAVVYVASFEVIKNSGFTTWWWGFVGGPIMTVVIISGFVIYRYRETRAMTLGQFFEIRYSRPFRLFTGMLGFAAGLVSFGIIPALGARFMVYMFGLPAELHLASWEIPTYVPLMGILLTINLFITLSGGLVTIIMTNCVEGILTQILNLVLIVGLLSMFSWSQISATLTAQPKGMSFLNPFDSLALKDFNVWYILMGIVLWVYGTKAWQNQGAYDSAPATAHEGRMGGLLGRLRTMGLGAGALLAICAMTYLHNPQFAEGAARVHQQVSQIQDPHVAAQMELPIAVATLLPAGLKGAFCVILLLGSIGGDSNHLHSWGSILVQDVILPFRKKGFSTVVHLRVLRLCIVLVALFAFVFGIIFRQMEYIMMWWAISGSIYIGGAGVAIIGGLYWKKGTTAAAWAGMLTGSILSVGGIVAKQLQGYHLASRGKHAYLDHVGALPDLVLSAGQETRGIYLYLISFNGTQIAFGTMLIAITVYVVVSLLTCRRDFDMDRMLHRGAYAILEDQAPEPARPRSKKINWGQLIGYDENFTLADKWIAGSLFAWSMLLAGVEIFGSLLYLVHPWSTWGWSEYWYYYVIFIPAIFAVIMAVWFTWGGIADTKALFKKLSGERVDPRDNGVVINHENLADEAPPISNQPLKAASTKIKPFV